MRLKNVWKCYENVKITSHNHSQHLLLYKLAEQSTSGLGRFSECRKCNIYISYNTDILTLPDIYALALGCMERGLQQKQNLIPT